MLVCPRVWVWRIGVESRPTPHLGRGGLVQVGLHTLLRGMELCAQPPQLACEAGRRLARGKATSPQHQRGQSLSRLFEQGSRQQRVVTLTGPTEVCRKGALAVKKRRDRFPSVGL